MSINKITQKEFFENILDYIDNHNTKTINKLSKELKVSIKDLKRLAETPNAIKESIEIRKRLLELQFWSIIPDKILEKINDDDISASGLSSLTNTYYKLLQVSKLNSKQVRAVVETPNLNSLESEIEKVLPFRTA